MTNDFITLAEMKKRIKETAKAQAKRHGLRRKQTRELIKLTTISLMGTSS